MAEYETLAKYERKLLISIKSGHIILTDMQHIYFVQACINSVINSYGYSKIREIYESIKLYVKYNYSNFDKIEYIDNDYVFNFRCHGEFHFNNTDIKIYSPREKSVLETPTTIVNTFLKYANFVKNLKDLPEVKLQNK